MKDKTPSTESQVENSQEEQSEEIVAVDRSAYNCPDCKGEGLNSDHTARCNKCNGTGKV